MHINPKGPVTSNNYKL